MATRIVTAVNGTPCVTFVDRSGKDFYMPLKLNKVKKEHRRLHRWLAAERRVGGGNASPNPTSLS